MMSAGISHPRSPLRVPTGVPMLYKTLSAAVYGIDANIIEVEVDVSGVKMSEDHFHTVGLPDAAVRESRERVRAALKNSGYDIPPTQITINLAPADIKKEGSGFDLPIALGARNGKIANLIVPEANAREAAVVTGLNVYPVNSLIQVVNLLNKGN